MERRSAAEGLLNAAAGVSAGINPQLTELEPIPLLQMVAEPSMFISSPAPQGRGLWDGRLVMAFVDAVISPRLFATTATAETHWQTMGVLWRQ